MQAKVMYIPKIKPLTLHISQENITAFFLLFPYLRVKGISSIFTDRIYSVGIVISFIAVILFHLLKIRHYDQPILIWFLYTSVMIASCALNQRNIFYAGYYAGKIIGFYLLNQYYLSKGKLVFLKTARAYMTSIIAITLIQQWTVQDAYGYTPSMNFETFFVSDNYLGYFYSAYIAMCVILDQIEESKIRMMTYIEILLCLISVIRSWAVKSILGLAVITIYVFFFYGKKITKFFTAKKLLMIYLTIYFGVVLFSFQNYLFDGFYDFFGKKISLSGRTYIWAAVFQNIKNSPMYGHGLNADGLWSENLTIHGKLFSAHNMILEVLIQVGILGLILYALFIFSSVKRGTKSVKPGWESEYAFLIFIIFMIYLMGIASSALYEPFYFMPLILLSNMQCIVDIREQEKINRKLVH